MKKVLTVTVLGAGNMGTALAHCVARNGHHVRLWNWEGEPEPLHDIATKRENTRYLPGVRLHARVKPVATLADALANTDIVFLSVATSVVEYVIAQAAPFLPVGTVIVDTTKGMPKDTCEFVPDIIARSIPKKAKVTLAVLAGPAIARQMAEGGRVAMTVGSTHTSARVMTKYALQNTQIRLSETSDVVGVKVGGLCKNILAIGMGICDGLGVPSNTKAALLTAGLEEIARLSVALGGKKDTVYGLSGMGDLIGTALAHESRNRRYGECRGHGMSHRDAIAAVGQVVEGVTALPCVLSQAYSAKVELPLMRHIERVVTGKKKPTTRDIDQWFLVWK